jgi:hypothetical protein
MCDPFLKQEVPGANFRAAMIEAIPAIIIAGRLYKIHNGI